ncbi:hypothetical protein D9756_008627 [Leucocoprinus leucothites]|uniref:Enoyl reductase (ER) domain-containing protein n=1 Tax=Leucocoprinus leucothites TaxID=201217 RepID=A0A8H5FUQ5_9AGAR|nr:hypothetical protein D9756_008627 [Leucoagaricus leucothites]
MKAARFYGPGDVRVENIPEPVAKEGQVKVKVKSPGMLKTSFIFSTPLINITPGNNLRNGICGSDLHAYLAPIPVYANKEPNPVTGETVPVTLGHEFAGTIVDVGPGVDANKWAAGTKVVIEPILSCRKGSCFSCSSGHHNICPHVAFIGCSGWGGGLAEFIAVDLLYVHRLPEGVPLEIGACVEPLSIAYHSVKRSNFKPGQTVLIAGSGPIGLFLLKVIKSLDPDATVLVSEPAAIRRQFALEHGASQVFDPIKEDIPTAVRKFVPPGVDVAFEAAGVQASLDNCLLSLRARGTYLNVALWEIKATIDINLILSRELNITGIIGYDHIHEEVLQLLGEGKFKNIEKLITRKIKLDDVVEDGLKRLISEKDKQVKILVSPS